MSDKDEIKEITESSTDKVDEYFKLKKALSEMRKDLKDKTTQHPDYDEMQKAKKKAKELGDTVKDDEDIALMREKTKQIKERMDLLKEIIRINLIEEGQEKVKQDGKALKLVYVLKEVKDEE